MKQTRPLAPARAPLIAALVAPLVIAGTLLPALSHAQQAWPSRSVRMVVGFPPGSAADVVARLAVPRIAEGLGQPVIVDNRAGASSNIGTEAVVRAAPDGYTILLSSVANTINASLVKGLAFDFLKDLAPVAGMATSPNLLVAHPSLNVKTVQELVAVAKSKPEGVLYGSSGNGTAPHLSGELFNLMAGTKLVHVPYKGSPAAVTDLLAGRVLVMFSPISSVLQHIKAGSVRALASTGAQRAGAAPDLPTVAEAGLPGYETSLWFGVHVPAATPREVIERLNREAARALGNAELRALLAAQGFDPMSGSAAQFGSYVRQDAEKWAKVVQASGAKVD